MTAPTSILESLIGWPPLAPPTKLSEAGISDPRVVEELRRWVVSQGVPPSAALGDPTYKLAAAYANQQYLRKWAEGAAKDSWRKRDSKSVPIDWGERSPSVSAPAPPVRPNPGAESRARAPDSGPAIDAAAIAR